MPKATTAEVTVQFLLLRGGSKSVTAFVNADQAADIELDLIGRALFGPVAIYLR